MVVVKKVIPDSSLAKRQFRPEMKARQEDSRISLVPIISLIRLAWNLSRCDTIFPCGYHFPIFPSQMVIVLGFNCTYCRQGVLFVRLRRIYLLSSSIHIICCVAICMLCNFSALLCIAIGVLLLQSVSLFTCGYYVFWLYSIYCDWLVASGYRVRNVLCSFWYSCVSTWSTLLDRITKFVLFMHVGQLNIIINV